MPSSTLSDTGGQAQARPSPKTVGPRWCSISNGPSPEKGFSISPAAAPRDRSADQGAFGFALSRARLPVPPRYTLERLPTRVTSIMPGAKRRDGSW